MGKDALAAAAALFDRDYDNAERWIKGTHESLANKGQVGRLLRTACSLRRNQRARDVIDDHRGRMRRLIDAGDTGTKLSLALEFLKHADDRTRYFAAPRRGRHTNGYAAFIHGEAATRYRDVVVVLLEEVVDLPNGVPDGARTAYVEAAVAYMRFRHMTDFVSCKAGEYLKGISSDGLCKLLGILKATGGAISSTASATTIGALVLTPATGGTSLTVVPFAMIGSIIGGIFSTTAGTLKTIFDHIATSEVRELLNEWEKLRKEQNDARARLQQAVNAAELQAAVDAVDAVARPGCFQVIYASGDAGCTVGSSVSSGLEVYQHLTCDGPELILTNYRIPDAWEHGVGLPVDGGVVEYLDISAAELIFDGVLPGAGLPLGIITVVKGVRDANRKSPMSCIQASFEKLQCNLCALDDFFRYKA